MESKKIRDLILTLVVLIVGIKLLVVIGLSYISDVGFSGLTSSMESMSDILIIGLAFMIIILVPFYLSKRSEEKKKKS